MKAPSELPEVFDVTWSEGQTANLQHPGLWLIKFPVAELISQALSHGPQGLVV